MSRYETYKPSGIDWIGEVPEHWEVKRLKNIILNDIGGLWGDEPADDENDIIVLRVVDFDRLKSRIIDNPEFTYRNIKPSQLYGRILKQGDILLEKSGGGEQQPVGKAVLFDKDFKAVTSNFINKIETLPSVNNHFALYLFDALYYNNINVRNINQTTGIQNLDNTGFFGEKISLPPKPEQLAIANYLDDQTQKIDRLIANKKAQAEKLKELRQIEINNAVTKGLNPNVEMKDSGIEWLGKIPKHWEVKRLKNVSNFIQTGITPPSEKSEYYDGDIPWYGPGGFNGDTILSNPAKYITQKAIEDNEAKLFPIDCIFMIGIGATIGKVGIIKEPSSCNQQLNIVNFKSYVSPDFGVHLLKTYENIIIKIANFSTLPIYNQVQTGNLKFLLPPKEEQLQIAKYLQERTAAIDKLIINIDSQIEKLQELRKIKIYEAVTGKIKVNGYESIN